MSKRQGIVTRAVHTVLSLLLGRVLDDRMKRLILFASLSAKFCGDKTKFNSATLHKLNNVMALSSNDQALALPVHLSKVIWQGDSDREVLYPTATNPEPEDELVNKIINSIPEWLRYSNKKGLREDLVLLLKEQELITA